MRTEKLPGLSVWLMLEKRGPGCCCYPSLLTVKLLLCKRQCGMRVQEERSRPRVLALLLPRGACAVAARPVRTAAAK